MKESRKGYRALIMTGLSLLVILLVFLFGRIYEVSRENALNSVNMEIGQRTKDIEFILQESVTELTLTADMVANMMKQGKSNEEILAYLENETETTAAVFDGNDTGLYGYIRGEYLDGAGWVPEEGYKPKTRPWYTEAAKLPGATVLVDPYVDAQTSSVLISISKMLSDYDSVVSFDVHLTRMQKQVEKIAMETGWHTFVVAQNGMIAASSHRDDIGQNLKTTDDEYLSFVRKEYEQRFERDFTFQHDGESYTIFDQPIYGAWRVLIICDSEGIYETQAYLYIAAAALLVLVLIYVTLVIAYTNRRRKKAEDTSAQLQSIADIYVTMYKLDLEKGVYEEKRGDSYIRKLVRNAPSNPVEMVRDVTKHLMRDRSPEAWSEFFDLEMQTKKMYDTDVATHEFETIKGWMRARYIVTERKGSEIRTMLWLMENIDDEKRREEKLRREAIHDELTGLYNRRAYENKLRAYSEQEIDQDFICVVMDMNGLKATNDTLGHAAGDELLKAAAYCMSQCFGGCGTLYRTGGDEFVALLHAGEAYFARMTEEFDETVAAWKGMLSAELSISYGSAAKREFPSLDVMAITKVADDRMYEKKRNYYQNKETDRRRKK